MDLSKTVFILGAGASLPYGYPTAFHLRNDIINNYENVISDSFKAFGNNGEDLEDFKEEILPLIKKFDESNTKSIDLFLTRSENKRYMKIGTQLIWLFINWYEMKNTNNLRAIDSNNDWYLELFNELTENHTNKSSLGRLTHNYITFITFNYDRSLEDFLFNSFLNSFPTSQQDVKQLLDDNFNIYHVYGKTIDLYWEGSHLNSKYGSETSLLKFNEACNNIKLIYDVRQKIPVETQEFLEDAKRIFLLGFGFAEVNLKFLNIKSLINNKTEVYATSIGLGDAKKERINEFLRNNKPEMEGWQVNFENCSILELLKRHLF